jgi:hypothetical protein
LGILKVHQIVSRFSKSLQGFWEELFSAEKGGEAI